MEKMEKKTTVIFSIIFSIVILIIVIPIFWNSVSNLQQVNQEKESSEPAFVSLFLNNLGNCTGTTGDTLDNCKQSISSLQAQCNFYNNPPVCNDPRIPQILTSTAQTVIAQPSANFVTYTNSQYGFSIDYPSNWVIDNNLPDGSIGLKDKMISPDVLFEIKQMPSVQGSFDTFVKGYINQAGIPGYAVTLQSQDKVTVGNKDAYKIQYIETIGSSTCKYEDYVINDGSFAPVISYNNCDTNVFAQFLPTYERVVSTFR
jgi:hypothetical protein